MTKKIMSQNGAEKSERQANNSSFNSSTESSENSNKLKTKEAIKTINKFKYFTPITKKMRDYIIPQTPKKKRRTKDGFDIMICRKNLTDIFNKM